MPQFDEQKKKYFKTKFIRVLKKQPDDNLGYGMYHYLNKILVAGSYTLTDGSGTKSSITFNVDGKLNGFRDFNTYDINIDLNTDANDNLDEIGFDNLYTKHHSSYSFKIIADTLNLYETLENADSTKLILGKLNYKLVRQK